MATSVSIDNLHVERGSFCLEVEHLEIQPGETFAILGRTGSGKTVLLESIAYAFPLHGRINHGTVKVGNKNIERVPLHERGMGVVYQEHALFPHMTVGENIAYGLKMHRVPKREIVDKVDAMTELLGISHIANRRPGIISGGEAQRCALARALVLIPEILLLDEPFSALDPTTKALMYETMDDIRQRFGMTMVFVTHDFVEAQRLADRVGIVLDGRLRCVVEARDLLDENAPIWPSPTSGSSWGCSPSSVPKKR